MVIRALSLTEGHNALFPMRTGTHGQKTPLRRSAHFKFEGGLFFFFFCTILIKPIFKKRIILSPLRENEQIKETQRGQLSFFFFNQSQQDVMYCVYSLLLGSVARLSLHTDYKPLTKSAYYVSVQMAFPFRGEKKHATDVACGGQLVSKTSKKDFFFFFLTHSLSIHKKIVLVYNK